MTGRKHRRTEKCREGEKKRAWPTREDCGRGEPGQRTGTACGAREGSDDGGRKGRFRALVGTKTREVGVER
jgi:hypothetical protein